MVFGVPGVAGAGRAHVVGVAVGWLAAVADAAVHPPVTLPAPDAGMERVRLPAVAEFATQYAVAHGTVVAALRRIEADELIEIVANWGTFRK